MKQWRLWTAEEVDLLRQLVRRKWPQAEIAARLGKTKAAISAKKQKMNLYTSKNHKWSDDEIALIGRLRQSGLRWADIASAVGQSRSTTQATYRYHSKLKDQE